MGMETPIHQEWRSRQQVNWKAVASTSLFVGGVLFIMSGGSPWSTAGTMNAIMGRDLPIGFLPLILLHFLLSFLYVTVIAQCIYRLKLVSGVAAGVLVSMGLYAINYAVFHSLPVQMQSPEGRAFFVHVTFALFASAAYKGASVPRPLRGDQRAVLEQTHRLISSVNPYDPEPVLVADR